MSWKKSANELNRPLLQSLWKHGMVGIREGVVNNVPGLLEGKLFFIDKDSEQLNSGNSWMSIIQLNLILVRELCESIAVVLLVSSNDIVDGGGAEEVLLLESQLLTGISIVVWIQH